MSSERVPLKFDDRHVEPILDGEKWITIRHDLDHDLAPGDRLQLVDAETGEPFADATVSTIGELPAREVVAIDFDGHRSYRDVGALLDELRRYYPDAALTPETTLSLVDFGHAVEHRDYDRGPVLDDPRAETEPLADERARHFRGDRL